MARVTDTELVAICEAEIASASGWSSGELADERADALEYYLGEPYGDEVDGRSQIVTREVLDTIEWIKPSLMRIFCDSDNLVVFDPVGPEDEEQAEQESDRVNYEFWKRNRGFFNLYSFVTDALLSKTGNLKAWWDDAEEEEREEYKGINDIELSLLMSEEGLEREVIEYEMTELGHHIVFKTTRKMGHVAVEPCPPEEFGINRDARTPYAQDAQFVYHRTRKTMSDLREMGIPQDVIDRIPTNDDVETEERLARRHLDDEQDILRFGMHRSMRQFWVTECYLRIDRDDDGIAELLKVMLAAGNADFSGGSILLDTEDVDIIPFYTAPPVILTHKFYGLSIADLVMDLQEIKSTLLRLVLDNTYASTNQSMGVNERVNLDDVLTNRPNRVIRTKGAEPPANNIFPVPSQPVPSETFGLLEYLDELRKGRTGVSDETAALDKTALGNVNTGVFALAYDAARAKIELIARILAEVGLRPLFKDIHQLLQKNIDRVETIKLRGNWVQVHPSEWRTRHNMTVQVGMGNVSRERRMMAMEAVMEKQAAAVQGGGLGAILTADNLYRAVSDYTKLWGLEPSLYWMDPAEAEPQEPEPDYQGAALQIQGALAESQMQRNAIDARKQEADERYKMAELELRQQESQAKAQLEALKLESDRIQADAEATEQAAKDAIDAEIKITEQKRKEIDMRLKDAQEWHKRERELYKTLIESGTKLTTEQIKKMDGDQPDRLNLMFTEMVDMLADGLKAVNEGLDRNGNRVGEMQAQMVEMREQSMAPRVFVRDESGRVVSINGQPVRRDGNGRVVGIG